MTALDAGAALVLSEDQWRDRARAHESRVEGWVRPHLARRAEGRKHPVEDFLWTYYSYRPAQLRRWHPGPGVVLAGHPPHRGWRGYVTTPVGTQLDLVGVEERRLDTVRFVRRLLAATAGRSAQTGCFGMHEWAMVYRQPAEQLRHSAYALRLGPDGTDAVVESHQIRCSHYDAHRFFTPDAAPRNVLSPTLDQRVDLEQPGCLHANMDLYKWSSKLSPLVPSDLVADCFELAREIRELDMRASPYDLSELGVEPVCIETPEGKQEYVAAQRAFAAQATELRERLLDCCDRVLGPALKRPG